MQTLISPEQDLKSRTAIQKGCISPQKVKKCYFPAKKIMAAREDFPKKSSLGNIRTEHATE